MHKDIRIMCDASHNGLGAVLKQPNTEGWRLISFASRYLNDAKKRYLTNELEMLAVVWGAEYFRKYVLRRKFQVVTDHEALVSLLKGNSKKNRTMFSRLTRWLDRLIVFDFEVEHMPLAKIGLADYLSRQPNSEAKPVSTYDSMFTVAKNRSVQSALGYETKLADCSTSVNNEASNRKLANGNRICKFRKEKPTVEGEKSCYNKTANKNAKICIRHWSQEKLCRR